MIISVGIFAYNESDGIAEMLRVLFEQDLFTSEELQVSHIQVICIPNGCTDATAQIARAGLAEGARSVPDAERVSWRVDELEIASKSNAWNYFIHEASRPDAEYLICLDADIGLPQRTCLSGVLQRLRQTPDAYVAVDEAVKDIVADQTSVGPLTWLNRLITRQKRETRKSGVNVIAGSLFCGRSAALRNIWLPRGLVRAEDGFIKAMVITNCFTTPEEHHRLVLAPDCYHTFEAYNTLRALFRHNRNQHVGVTVNAIVYEFLWANSRVSKHAGDLIREFNEAEPGWLDRMVGEQLTLPRRRSVFEEYLSDPFRNLFARGAPRSARGALVALLQTLLRLPVALEADQHLRRGRFEW